MQEKCQDLKNEISEYKEFLSFLKSGGGTEHEIVDCENTLQELQWEMDEFCGNC